MSRNGYEKKQPQRHENQHPYLAGNFAPVTESASLQPARFTGVIPPELHGGMYVRNGGNPITNSDLGRDAHWFDGDGMLTGVWFDGASPQFVSQFILTDLAISALENQNLRTPILPSIATLVNPVARLVVILWRIFRSALLVLISHLSGSAQSITRISVANTSVLYHDGRALAACESGPPIRVQLPGLETVGWFDGNQVEEEPPVAPENDEPGFGGTGINSWMREWTTGHPKVDPTTGEMILFHCNFLPPFVHYSVVPPEGSRYGKDGQTLQKMLNAPVPGCSGGKMMHDFGVSKHHTVILDLPLSLSPFNLLKNNPVVSYDPSKPSRFGVFPRQTPSAVRWYETDGCCIFHTANTWDEVDVAGNVVAVNMLACRLTSSSLVFSAGNINPPPHPNHPPPQASERMSFFAKYDEDDTTADPESISSTNEKTPLLIETAAPPSPYGPPSPPILEDDEEQCRLYYYRFDTSNTSSNSITAQYALSSIPFEFPTVSPQHEMSSARYIYGCSTTNASFGAALGKATKIDVVIKADIQLLLRRAKQSPPERVTGCLDTRSIQEIIAASSKDAEPDSHQGIHAFLLPPHHFAQEPRFVPRSGAAAEDDGFLLFYVFDESQLDEHGECRPDAYSELWVLDASDMRSVVCKVQLPRRVPYGLHGNWFGEEKIRGQRKVREGGFRKVREDIKGKQGWFEDALMRVVG